MTMQSLIAILVPATPRRFTGQRWINILLRSLHLVGIAGVGAGFLFALPQAQWLLYWQLALTTGIGLSLLYLWSSAIWLVQLKGVAILLKLVLLGVAFAVPGWRTELFTAVVILSAVMAHAPGQVRGFALIPALNRGRVGC